MCGFDEKIPMRLFLHFGVWGCGGVVGQLSFGMVCYYAHLE